MRAETSVYRERFALTLAHKPVDRCPLDLGGTPQSTVEEQEGIRELAGHLGFSGRAPDDYDKFDRRVLEYFDIDFRRVGALVDFQTKRTRRVSETEVIDCYGIRHRFGGLYWEIVEGPLRGATLDDLARYELPEVGQIAVNLDALGERARAVYEQSPYVIVGEHPVYGVLELACWLCGYDHIMMTMALEPEFIHALFRKILAFQKRVIKEYYGRLGRWMHVTTSGDDFGTQKALFMSPQMWREYVKPYMRERIAYTAQFTDAVYMHHSCGAIFEIIPDLIEIGVRILNPIQPGARGMEPERLKAAYGDEMVFHGGLDTQQVLPSNDVERIKGAVRHLLEVMSPMTSGGYIFAPAHNVQRDVRPEAVARMYEAALGYFGAAVRRAAGEKDGSPGGR